MSTYTRPGLPTSKREKYDSTYSTVCALSAEWDFHIDGDFNNIDSVDVDYSPTNYQVLTQDVSGHLHGINEELIGLSEGITDNITIGNWTLMFTNGILVSAVDNS